MPRCGSPHRRRPPRPPAPLTCPNHRSKITSHKIGFDNVSHKVRLHTDESKLYAGADKRFASHETVKHSAKGYVRGDVHTNSAERFFSILKRGLKGIYQHCREKHLHRYLAEYDFRYSHRVRLGYGDME